MATPAGDRRLGGLAGWLALLKPAPGRWAFALRLALLCTLTTLVVEVFQTPEAALTVYVCFFVIKPDRATSVILGLAMLCLITLVVGAVMLLSMGVIDHPLLRVGAMAVLSLGLLFVASASKLRPVGGILALIVAYALDLLSNAQIGELATRALLYAWLFVGIPVGVSVAVHLLAGPAPRRLAERALAHRLAVAAAALRVSDARARRALGQLLSQGSGEILTWLKMAAVEKTSVPEDLAALRQAAASVNQILLLAELVSGDRAGRWPPLLRDRVAGTLDEMASILRAGGYPVDIELDADGPAAALLPEGAAILQDMREALLRFAEPPALASRAPAQRAGGFFLPDAFTDPAHVQYALKTTAAAMFCYFVYSLLDWPGIHTSLITCYIVSLGTAAETVEKLTLRIAGCLVGAAAGVAAMIFVMPHLSSIGGLLAIVFLAAFASAWVAAGSPRIAYAGFQIAFAFFLCVVQGAGPGFDMTIARDRVIGILFGNLVVYVMFTTVWPVSVTRRIDPAIASVLRRLSAMVKTASRPGRYALAGDARAALGMLEQDMGLARYEPRSIRPAQAWLDTRRRATRKIAALQGALLLGARFDPAGSGAIAARLDRLADGVAGPAGPSGERESFETQLENLERSLTHATESAQQGGAGHGPA